MTTHLQGLGTVKSKAAGDFKVGESMLWNYGFEEAGCIGERHGGESTPYYRSR